MWPAFPLLFVLTTLGFGGGSGSEALPLSGSGPAHSTPSPEEPDQPVLVNAVYDPPPGSDARPRQVLNPIPLPPTRQATSLPAAPLIGQTSWVNLETLVAIYTNSAMGSLTIEDVERLKAEVENTGKFIWRHSHLKLRLNITYLVIDAYKDITEFDEVTLGAYWLPPGDNDGDGESVENDLIANGVQSGQYDSINYFWAHNGDYGAAYGGLGGLIYWSLGLTGTTQIPIFGSFLEVEGGTAFPHEIHHTIDAMFDENDYPNYFFPDRPWDLPGAFGENWDFWVSGMQRIPPADWLLLTERWGTVVYADDADNDGVPDAAVDGFPSEAWFGSSAALRDTDSDRLEDLPETMAGTFLNASLLEGDTDADAIVDGDDPYPLYAIEIQVLDRSQPLDGDPSSWDTLTTVLQDQNAPLDISIAANWDNDYLYLMVIEDRYAGIHIQLDVDDDGWFHGKDNYELIIDPSYSNPTDPNIVGRAHIWDSSEETIAWNGVPMWDDDPNYPGSRLVQEEDILRYARSYAGGYLVQLAIPRNEPTGLTPGADREFGLLLKFNFIDRKADTYARIWEKDAWVRLIMLEERDEQPPVSQVDALPVVTHQEFFTVSWGGTDGGSGVRYYDLQVRDGGDGAWSDWLRRTSSTSDTYGGVTGHTYYFRARAWDRAGNVEAYPLGDGDTSTTIEPPHRIYLPLVRSASTE